MMEAEAKKVKKDFPEIALWSTNIDAQMMWLTKNPEEYGVIVAGNMFGDIASDGFAGLVGGLGFAASANIGREVAVFEPTHGSAPKYEKLQPSIVNPIAMILTAVMMLDHIGETDQDIEKLFGAWLDRILNPELRQKTVAVWVEGCRRGGWDAVAELKAMPFTLLTETKGINLVEHTLAVTAGAVGLAEAQQKAYAQMPYAIDRTEFDWPKRSAA